MKNIFLIICLLLPQIAGAQAIRVDHTTVDLTNIPDAALPPAANLRVMLRRASVGGNISDGLNVLQTGDAKYDRSRWIFYDRGNSGWQSKISEFVSFTNANVSNYDVFSMKFCFIDPDAGFTNYRDALLQLEAAYPTKRFVWWTIPIETSGNTNRQSFNDFVRAYAMDNGKILFDIADIESHNAAGEKRIDGSNRELMWPEWTSDGGHLSSDGARRVASAWWWLMARVAGWDGSLPVQMTLFTASVQGMSTELHWSTATEVNNYGFDIERRKIGVERAGTNSWEKIDFVSGFGTSNSPHEYFYSDSRLEAGRYMYRLKQIDNGGAFEYSLSIEVEVGTMPHIFTLSQNYPNPFNPTTTIEFSLAEKSKVLLKVYDILGREVALLLNGEFDAGILHRVKFDAIMLESGIYFYRLQGGSFTKTKKLLFLK